MDDDTFSVFSLQTLLKQVFGLESDFAYSGQDALRSLQTREAQGRRQYALVFMDLNMPEMNGLETTSILRRLARQGQVDLASTKVVLYSCLANTSDLPSLRAEFDEVANKPISVPNLRQILHKYALL